MRAARDLARRILDDGFCPVPVAPGSKKPVAKGWQSFTKDVVEKSFDKLFPEGSHQNVGVLLGAASGGLIDIDLDWPEARQLAPKFLPATTTFGRASSRASHYLYRCNPVLASRQFTPPGSASVEGAKKPHIVELRADKRQTVWPGSVHESGELIEWDTAPSPGPSFVAPDALERAVGKLAAASYLVSRWGQGHSRDELSAALAGGLIADGLPLGEVAGFLDAVTTAAGDEERRSRLAKVTRAEDILLGEKQGAQLGWPTVARLLGADVCDWLQKLLLPPRNSAGAGEHDDIVAELNAKHAAVNVGGQFRVITELVDGAGGRAIIYSSRADFCHRYEATKVRVGERSRSIAQLWLNSPKRRQYDRIVFAPHAPGRTPVCPGGAYNLFKGFPVEPRKGDCSLYLDHIKNTICSGKVELYEYVIHWMADAVQNVGRERPGVALVLRGAEGTGKGIFVKQFGRLFGSHFRHINRPGHLVGNFNAHLQDTVLLFADEAYWAGNKADEGVLKGLITEETLMIEPKGVNPFEIQNHIRFIFATNNDWAVPAGLNARRFVVLDVNDKHKQDSAHFKAIVDQMNAGGSEALLHYLLNVDLTTANLRRIPVTAALLDQKRRTMAPVEAWFYERAKEGSIRDEDDRWPVAPIPKGELYRCFQEYARGTGKHVPDLSSFGMSFCKLLPGVGETRITVNGKRVRAYVLPSLADCRARIDEVLGGATSWPEEPVPEPCEM